jgi:hypothetical protein
LCFLSRLGKREREKRDAAKEVAIKKTPAAVDILPLVLLFS